MTADVLTGSRIRERRQIARLKQAELADRIGISASYLNLIEHNRRRIGGKLLLRIAEVLGVEASALSEGAEAALIATLREAEADLDVTGVETDRIEEFAGRFPGWARLLAASQRRIVRMEHAIEALSERLTHDPALAASVHEVLSTAASIRSTASILAETDALEREWLDRFHNNINQDSARLAESSRELARYLEQGQKQDSQALLPQEEVDRFLEDNSYRFADLEAEPRDETVRRLLDANSLSPTARDIAANVLSGYARDAAALPLARLEAALQEASRPDPAALALALGAPAGLVLRRMASLPGLTTGYVLADRSGSLLLRKALPGFSLPRFGASCPLWPLFLSLTQPGTLIHQEVEQLGRAQAKFDCYAISEPLGTPSYNRPPLVRAGMLILPAHSPGPAEVSVGSSCRVCPREACEARREPSVVSDR